MKADEYEKELRCLYGKALDMTDLHLALEILERGRAIGLEQIRPPMEIPKGMGKIAIGKEQKCHTKE